MPCVRGAGYLGWDMSPVFHDIDLAAIRPANFTEIGAQHPQGGPGSGSLGKFRFKIYTTVLDLGFVFGYQSG